MRLQSASLFPHWCSRMGRVLSVCLLVVGVIHLLPIAGVVGASRLSALYGIAVAEPNLELLLRHRASALLDVVEAARDPEAAAKALSVAVLASPFFVEYDSLWCAATGGGAVWL